MPQQMSDDDRYQLWATTQWKGETGGQGDYYQWLRDNDARLKAAYANTVQGASQQASNQVASGQGASNLYYRQWADYITKKYGEPPDKVFKRVNRGELAVNGQRFDPNDSLDAFISKYKSAIDNANAGQQQQAPDDAINAQLQAFINQMSGPVGPNDQIANTLAGYGGAEAAKAAAARGLTGGISGASAQQGAQNALLPYLQARQQLAIQGIGALSSRDLALKQAALNQLQVQNQINQTNNASAAANYASQQNQNSSIGSVIGGVAGAIPGILLAPYTGGASLGLIGAGSAIGGGIGSLATGPAPAYKTSQISPSTLYKGPSGGAF